MKKTFFLIPVLGLMFSCSGEKRPADQSPEVIQEQTQAIEESTQKLDESIKSSEYEMEKTQGEIDSLLNNI